ncbi:MAG: hypothetical protein H6832_04190 [Planctomycetes bacterium]|nr:hypothetical protein [Planctomycetota bacterium]
MIPLTRISVALLVAGTLAAQDAPSAGDAPAPATEQASEQETQEPAETETDNQGEDDGPDVVAASDPYQWHGLVDMRFESRTTGGDHDNDLYVYSRARLGDPRKHAWTFSAAARGALDMDHTERTNVFRSFQDRRRGDLTAFLYNAHVDLNGQPEGSPVHGTLERIRFGRQVLTDTPMLMYLDGVTVETVPVPKWGDLIAVVYGGLPSHIFESSPTGDFAAGAAVSFSPWTQGRARVDWMHVKDDYLASSYEDDLLGLRFDQYLGRSLALHYNMNLLDFDRLRDLAAYATYSNTDSDFSASIRYSALVSDENKTRAVDFDYFTEILATYYAYDQVEFSMHKGLTDELYVEGGFDIRELRRDANQGIFNREFRRYYVTAGVSAWPDDAIDASVTFELWDSSGDRFTTVGADLRYDFSETTVASIGTMFQAFRYDPLRGLDNEDVQVSFAKLDHRLSDKMRLRGRFDYEDGDTYNFSTLMIGLQVDF